MTPGTRSSEAVPLERSGKAPGAVTARNGVLLVDKEAGETSYDVVRRVKRLSAVRKVGHAGTLDPFSTGLLIVMLGQGTKLMPYLMAGSKRYRAEIRLGVETDTYDPEGRVVQERPVPKMRETDVLNALERFLGEIEQLPPAFSAVRVDGTRAYKLARKGMDVQLQTRRVVVHAIDLLSITLPLLSVEVHCSAGTYLRSLAHDLGELLGTGAHLVGLRRMTSGSFQVEDAVESRLLVGRNGRDELKERLVPLARALPDMRTIRVGRSLADRIRNGYQPAGVEILPASETPETAGTHVQLLCDGELVAIVETTPNASGGKGGTKISRVFN